MSIDQLVFLRKYSILLISYGNSINVNYLDIRVTRNSSNIKRIKVDNVP